jgi:hypothetical protein
MGRCPKQATHALLWALVRQFKANATVTTRNMRNELCIHGDLLSLVEGLSVGGGVMKGMDGDSKSYQCGILMFGQTLLSSELNVSIDAHV